MPNGHDRTAGKRKALASLNELRADFQRRIDVIDYAKSAMVSDNNFPDVASAVTLPPSLPKDIRPWAVRPGSQADRVVALLQAAGEKGVSEPEIVAALRQQGLLMTVKDPIASVHWTLYNLRRRSGAVTRDVLGRWTLIGAIPRRQPAE